MGAFRLALEQLAQLNVAGVSQHYGMDAVPARVLRAQLPCLLVLPGEVESNRLFKQRGEGFQAVAFSGGGRTLTVAVTHLLLAAPATYRPRDVLPQLIDLVDAYAAALAADVLLGDTLREPPRFQVEVGRFHHGGDAFHGCAFRHLWLLEV